MIAIRNGGLGPDGEAGAPLDRPPLNPLLVQYPITSKLVQRAFLTDLVARMDVATLKLPKSRAANLEKKLKTF